MNKLKWKCITTDGMHTLFVDKLNVRLSVAQDGPHGWIYSINGNVDFTTHYSTAEIAMEEAVTELRYRINNVLKELP